MSTVSTTTPPVNFSLPDSFREAAHHLRARLIELRALSAAAAEMLSAAPCDLEDAQALAGLKERLTAEAFGEVNALCAALDALMK